MTRYRKELDAYAEQTETTDRDMAIARARWEGSRLERIRREERSWSFPVRIGLAGAMVAAAAALFLQLSPSGIDPQQPLALGEAGEVVDVELREGIRISGDGQGVLSGARADRRVALESGAMRFEVTPDAGLSLAVQTGEGTVTVVGTVFEVSRDALGTSVSVERGEVQVDCVGGSSTLVTGGHSALCRSALGLLEHGKAVRAAGEGPEAVLAAIEGAASLDAEPSVRVALDQLASRSALLAGGCQRAMPWLERLHGAGAEGVDLVNYGTCLSQTDPVAARVVFEEALAAGLEPALEARVKEKLGL